MLRGAAPIACFLGLCAQAQDLGSLNVFDVRLPLHQRFVLTAHTRLRSSQHLSNYFQSRAGAVGSTQLTHRLGLATGYYFIDQRRSSGMGHDSWQRVFAGPVVTLHASPRATLESRTLYERFLSMPGGGYNRFRQRIALDLPRARLRPWTQVEALLTRVPGAQGDVVNRVTRRYGAGIGLPTRAAFKLRLGLEYRQNLTGPGIVNLVSVVEWRPTIPQ